MVSRRGELASRIQLPPGYSLVGFGRGKVVYLSMYDASGIHLARVRLRPSPGSLQARHPLPILGEGIDSVCFGRVGVWGQPGVRGPAVA